MPSWISHAGWASAMLAFMLWKLAENDAPASAAFGLFAGYFIARTITGLSRPVGSR